MQQLPPEKLLTLEVTNRQFERMDREQAIAFLKHLNRLLFMKDEAYKDLLKQHLMEGFDPMPQDLQTEIRVVIESERLVSQQELNEAVEKAIAAHEKTGATMGVFLFAGLLLFVWIFDCILNSL